MIDKCRVAQPVGDSVFLQRCLYDEGAVGVEVKSFDLRQRVVAVAEVEVQPVRLLSLGLYEIAVGLLHGESPEYEVVGEEVRIVNTDDIVYT